MWADTKSLCQAVAGKIPRLTLLQINHDNDNSKSITFRLYNYATVDKSEKAPDAVRPLGKNGWVSWCQENSYSSSSEWLEKAGRTSSYLLADHSEERHTTTSSHNLSVEDATELALDGPLWRLLAASGVTHWNGASWTMMMTTTNQPTLF